VSENILPCSTDYGKYQRDHSKTKFSVVFPTLPRALGGREWMGHLLKREDLVEKFDAGGTILAPERLTQEMAELVAYKTAVLPPKGLRRRRRWAKTTAKMQVFRYGTVLGIFAAAQNGDVKGLGVSPRHLTLGLFVFPEIWEWYLRWYLKRRGFFTQSEISVLYEVKSLTRNPTGWVRQHPELSRQIRPIPRVLSATDVQHARRNWEAVCDDAFNYACDRVVEINPTLRRHRDPFAAILPVLAASSPLREYKKIGNEILRRMPDEKTRPMETATAVRNYVMFRLALHMGTRQRNLRELLLCQPGAKPRETRQLEALERGELRWNENAKTWDVFIPAVGVKNGASSFFDRGAYQLRLPNLDNLYYWLEIYIKRHRPRLLRDCPDPGTVFVRSLREKSPNREMNVVSFYSAWKLMIQRYGIYNPYTKRGAIKGLLPHGPNAVRDVLATHLLKKTGSYELASFAIQDSMMAVVKHYARFLPHEKIARAAHELNKVWQ
jgi:hypothetical protein